LRIAATEVTKKQRNVPIRSFRSRTAREVSISQIAEAFIVPNAAMEQVAACCARGDRRGARAALAPYRFEAFTWSGYVIVVLNEWLREHAIELPRSSAPAVQQFVQLHDPMLCAEAAKVDALAVRLDSVRPTADELSRYWTEFTGEDVPEALQFMTDGWGWLARLVGAGASADWCVLLEG
jgi:hypothetical protein